MKIIRIVWILFLFSVLTLLTQVGGVVYLLSLLFHKYLNGWSTNKVFVNTIKCALFLVIYCVATFLVVPGIAKSFGRVPLPMTQRDHLRPLNIITCILNRHYVKMEMRKIAFDVANQMNEKYPGICINYLDANFPFFDSFPLIPHLSHDDGKKLDLSFCYRNTKKGQFTNDCPSFVGYGICEEPLPGEEDMPCSCSKQGFWRYNLMSKIIPQGNKKKFIFDQSKTRYLIGLFIGKRSIEKIFIEPHLKTRLRLSSNKVRFHGCHAVRHDDHIHVEMK